jgi:hypothetical protein
VLAVTLDIMNVVEANLQEICSVICWNASWDINLNLSINFGQPSLSIVEPKDVETNIDKIREMHKSRLVTVRGEWLFWVLNGYWKLSLKDYEETTKTSSYHKKIMALARLDGQKLVHASVNSQTSATQLDFDLGAQLSIRRIGINYDGDIWSLYKPNGYVLSVRADGKYNDSHEKIHFDNVEWKPIDIS